MAAGYDGSEKVEDVGIGDKEKKKPKKKKKKKLVVRADLTEEAMSSDGLLEGRPRRDAAPKSNLGIPSKRRMKDTYGTDDAVGGKRLSAKAAKIKRQRTAGGSIDSSFETVIAAPPEDQKVQVQAVKRGNKTVTVVRGLTSPMDNRKKLLKEMKSKLGGGGTLVDGVLELQGSHGGKVLKLLKAKGYLKARVVGK